jgi:tetratricopeptide (TPR) repeat protein
MSDLGALVAAALLLADGGHWKRARAVVDKLPIAESKDARVAFVASRVKLAYSDLEGASKLAERAAELDPNNADYRHQLAEVFGTIAHRAPVWRQLGPGRRCKKEMDAAFALDPRHVENLFILMQYYQQAPGFMGGDKKRAAAMPEEIRRIDPARGWMAEAKLAELRKDTAAVARSLDKAVEANPRHYGARIELARHRLAAGGWDDVDRHARAARDIHPDRIEAHQLLAQAAARIGGLDAVLAEAEKLVPDDLSPLYYAAKSVGKGPRASAWIARYLQHEPEPTAPTHAEARKLSAR